MSMLTEHIALDPIIRFRLFGPLEILGFGGESVLPRGRKARAILCHLALSADGSASRQRLVDLLWSRREPEQGRGSLRQSLLEIRGALGSEHEAVLSVERDRVTLDRSRIWIDGLSRHADEEPDAKPGLRADYLLEGLTGIDPAYDLWVADVRGRLALAIHAGSPGRARPPRTAETGASAAMPVDFAASRQGDRDSSGLVLAVAPLLQIGPRRLDDYVAPALTQEIVTALARLRWIKVRLSRASHCDASYRLEGYISRLGDGCRVVMRLVDQSDRDLIAWSGAVDAAYPLRFSSICEVVDKIAMQLDPEILAIETRKAIRRPHPTPDSYECVLRAIPQLYSFERESWRTAAALLQRAVECDPDHGRAWAFSALCRATGLAQGWAASGPHELRKLDAECARAIACDPRDSLALALGGHLRSFLHHDFEGAMALFARSVRANPSCGFAWAYSSLTYAYQGQTAEAARRFERAQAIMVHDPFSSFIEGFNAVIRYFEGEWEETIAICRRQLELRPSFTNIRKLLIGALCLAGRRHEARAEAAALQQVEPGFTWQRHLETYPFARSSDRAALRAALLRAGFTLGEPDLAAGSAARPEIASFANRQNSGTHRRETLQ